MKKIMICIPTLASAGAERFATELACNIHRDKYEPIVLVTNKLDKNSSFYKSLKILKYIILKIVHIEKKYGRLEL